ncbi:MAG: complex I NDUFA9 subunit family protein [Pseudomonadota bacterium]
MSETAPLVTILGGSGFIGRYIAQAMARRGWRVRVAVRRPNLAIFVRTYGAVGQVEPIQTNLRDEASLRRAIQGADAVVNCIGIMAETGRQTFDALQALGAERAARIAAEEGVARFVQISAIGADPKSDSIYARTKAEGEQAVRDAFPGAVILRPSVVFGPEDDFFNRFAAMARMSPILPITGGSTRFQPVYVGDVAEAAARAAEGRAEAGIYELGGPQVETLRQLIDRMLTITRRRRWVIDMPPGLARIPAAILSFLQTVSFGLFVNQTLTRDQIALLGQDNVVSEGARTLADLGVQATAMASVLESYLYAYRPAGQYSRLTERARDMREG